MAYEQRDNSGTLFQNDRKENDRHPDYKGKIMIGGVLYELAAWTKPGRNGDFLSLSVKPWQERGPARSAPEARRAGGSRSLSSEDYAPF